MTECLLGSFKKKTQLSDMKLLVLFRLHICYVVSQKTVGLFKTNFLSSANKVPSTMDHLMQYFAKEHFVLKYVQLFFQLSQGLLGYVVWGQFYSRVEVKNMVSNLEKKRFPLFSKDKNNHITNELARVFWITKTTRWSARKKQRSPPFTKK